MARGKRSKESVEGHLRQQLCLGSGRMKGTARPGTELLKMNTDLNLFSYEHDDMSKPLDSQGAGVHNRSIEQA